MTILHDVTERKLASQRQLEAQEEIEQSNFNLATALEELRQSKDYLMQLNNQLEEKVQDRTLELAKSEKQLRLIADALPVLISYIDAEKRYRFNNKAYEEWFNKPLSDIQGKPMNEVVTQEVFSKALPNIEKVLQGENIQYEITMPHALKGNRFATVNYIPHIDQGRTIGFYAIVIDITDRVKNEQALQAALAEMEQKNQELSKINELLDNFVYMAAHDLKSPVANLKLLSGMLVRLDNTIHPELYAAIIESVNRLDNTINGLVEVIEVQSIHDIPVKELDFDAVFNSVTKEYAEEIKNTGSLIQGDFSHCTSIRYVEAYLQSIIKNLISNALKYHSSTRKLHLQISSTSKEGYILLTFQDNGMGMNLNKYKQHIFKPFTRFTNKASGKGLGLHLIKTMVEKNGGKVLVDSEIDKGTTFYVYLKEY
jgi:PAS domain S-box-containing protein